MKRFLFITLLLAGIGSVAYAQTDAVYSNGSGQRNGQGSDSNQNNNRHYDDGNNQQGNNNYQNNNG